MKKEFALDLENSVLRKLEKEKEFRKILYVLAPFLVTEEIRIWRFDDLWNLIKVKGFLLFVSPFLPLSFSFIEFMLNMKLKHSSFLPELPFI